MTRLNDDRAFAVEILPHVSRTFAPAIEILPRELGDPVRLAYLLCRAADTMEDAPGIPASRRAEWLLLYATLLSTDTPAEIGDLVDVIAPRLATRVPERRLISGLPGLWRLLERSEREDAGSIRQWVREMALGMARFVRMESDAPGGWTSLSTCEELSAYEYYVAGTVGCLLQDLIERRIHRPEDTDRSRRRRLGIAFGLGLQGTNIIQDLSVDRQRGWSYLPEEIAARHGVSTDRMHETRNRDASMAAIRELASRVGDDLDDGLLFVLDLPRRSPRIRLFSLWPLLLAIRTLTLLVSDHRVLTQRIRITRSEVMSLMRESTRRCLSNEAIRSLYERERRSLHDALDPSKGGAVDLTSR